MVEHLVPALFPARVDDMVPPVAAAAAPAAAPVAAAAPSDAGTRPRSTAQRADAGPALAWLEAMLDEIDYGMVLLGDDGRELYTNPAARAELHAEHALLRQGGGIVPRLESDAPLLAEALDAARRGLRSLLSLGGRRCPSSVAVVPLGAPGQAASPTLLMLGRRRICERLTAQGFARSHALSAAETRVLEALCQGLRPSEAAARLGVGVTTVRSHITSIRHKTGCNSLGELMLRIAALPPLVNRLRAVR